MSLDDLINKVGNMSNEDRVDLGNNCVAQLQSGFREMGFDQEKIGFLMQNFIRLFVSADRKCSVAEYEFIKSIYNFGLSYDEFYDSTNGGADPEFITLMDQLADSMSEDMKTALCMFGLCILVSDHKITEEEFKLFIRIVE
ncbi:MAG: hypothetical protein J6Y74_00415 [Clostridia bacterium]|nr:hypothetical protein [Clostridia bacterium]